MEEKERLEEEPSILEDSITYEKTGYEKKQILREQRQKRKMDREISK